MIRLISCSAFLLLFLVVPASVALATSDSKTRGSTVRSDHGSDIGIISADHDVPRKQTRQSRQVVPNNLKVAAFNVRIFGVNKMNIPEVELVLLKVWVERCWRSNAAESQMTRFLSQTASDLMPFPEFDVQDSIFLVLTRYWIFKNQAKSPFQRSLARKQIS